LTSRVSVDAVLNFERDEVLSDDVLIGRATHTPLGATPFLVRIDANRLFAGSHGSAVFAVLDIEFGNGDRWAFFVKNDFPRVEGLPIQGHFALNGPSFLVLPERQPMTNMIARKAAGEMR
jgi:hypothetical protein